MGRGTKHDQGKAKLSLVPKELLEATARSLEFGLQKYGKNNFKLGMQWSRPLDAALRHLMAFAHGEDNDPESGLNHLDHAAACIAFLVYYKEHHPGLDDRGPFHASTTKE